MNDRGFSERIATSSAFESALIQKIETMGFTVALNGTEHTHTDFVSGLQRSTDQTSLAIRFQPDAVAYIGTIPRSVYIEAKWAKNIEKTAYEQYMKLHTAGNVVALVFGKLRWRWNFVEQIVLIDGLVTVGAYELAMRHPVDENGWICPRGTSHWDGIKDRNPQASGTPYREIDQSSLLDWAQFRSEVIAILR